MDDVTLLYLLKGGHLNMPERVERGLWPHPPLSFRKVARYLAHVLEFGDPWFPVPTRTIRAGEVVHEGGTIERQGNRYIYRSRAAHPIYSAILNRSVETVFTNPHDAAVHYLKWDLNLPGDLDGWKVVDDE